MIKIEQNNTLAKNLFTKGNLITDGKIIALMVGNSGCMYLSGTESCPCYAVIEQNYSKWKYFTGKIIIENENTNI